MKRQYTNFADENFHVYTDLLYLCLNIYKLRNYINFFLFSQLEY